MNLNYPKLSGSVETQLSQLKSFLYQLVDNLNYSLDNISEENFSSETLKIISGSSSKNSSSSEIEAVKSLIIKTANTINKEMERQKAEYNGYYDAVSESFGEYKETLWSQIEQNAAFQEQIYERETEINALGASFNKYRLETSTYIRFGHLMDIDVGGILKSYDGIAVGNYKTTVTEDGEIIYDGNYNDYATFTAEEVAFWQNGVKIGWFSGNELHVTNSVNIADWNIGGSPRNFTVKYIGGDNG